MAVILPLFAMAPAAKADYGIESFSARTTDAAEAPYTNAGGHPYQSITEFSIHAEENLNGIYFGPVPGFIANPSAASLCTDGALLNDECPPGSRVGLTDVTRAGTTSTHPLYSLVPERGYPAQLGFKVENRPTRLSVFPRPRADSYGLTLATPNNPSGSGVSGFSARLCGYGVEGDGAGPNPYRCNSPSASAGVPFLSNPLDCSLAEPAASIAIDSVEHLGALRELGVPDLTDPHWKTAGFIDRPVTDCDDPLLAEQFARNTITTKALQGGGPVQADAPSGLSVGLEFPQSNNPTDLSTEFDSNIPQAPPPKDITVKLPAGLAISPASADGLGACSDQASDPAGDQVHYDTTKPVTCPDSAKIGTALAISPLLATRDPVTDEVSGAEPIPGNVYLLKPHPGDLPIAGNTDGKYRLLIELENPRYGVNFKLPGVATADRDTGQLTAVFTNNPQLPASHLTVDLKPGPRAPLVTPVTCGKFATTSTLVPWSAPGTPDAHPGASFEVGSGPGGSGCPGTPGQRPFAPTLETAGTDSAKAGAASPFTLEVTRPDGDQELSSLNFTAPPGFTAKLKGVASCSDAAIAAAQGKSGAEEQVSPSCSSSSRVGTVTVGAGPGSSPYYTQGTAYLAGPYKGAPLSFALITPAVAGPFDLGNIVFRAGAYLDPSTAQVTVKTDQLPQILDGIPLRLRSITIRLDRADFTHNPTDCEPMSVSATVNGSNGATANPVAFFQAGGCKDLAFRPRLAIDLLGTLGRNGHPAVRATLRAVPGEAGIATTTVTLPEGELLDLHQLGTLCARGVPPERCPRSSRIGQARVWSPLLADPLQGPIYLREPGARLPDLVADLRGGGLHFVLHGQTTTSGGRLRIRFPAVPDVPLSKAVLTLTGGRRGVVVNSEGLCARPRRASVSFSAHNGDQRQLKPLLRLRGRC